MAVFSLFVAKTWDKSFYSVENGRIFPICMPKLGIKILFSYSKEVVIMCDGSLTNNLLVVILFHN